MMRDLNDAEAALHQKFAAHAKNAAINAGLAASDGPLSPSVLDQLWSGWQWPSNMTDEEQKVAIAFFGFAFGEYIASRTGMRWCMASDDQGTDYALVLPKTDVTAFPLATVAKRLGQPAFFASIAPTLIRDINTASAGRAKPWWKVW